MKVGILTQYYGSRNYGGLLQAHALVQVLNANGHDSQQICYRPQYSSLSQDDAPESRKCDSPTKRYFYALLRRIEGNRTARVIENRNETLERFLQEIPHSDIVYTKETIKEANRVYDGFVVGSDQIWNPRSLDTSFFLDFAEKDKKKIAYAASVCRDELSATEKTVFAEGLKNLDAVSLRENCASLLQDLTDKPIEWVLDPTMLLPKEYWDTIACDRMIPDEYVLCYFLGDSKEQRKLAKNYAKDKRLLLVTMPHLAVGIEASDIGFGDKQMIDVSPEEFLSLIKHASCVLTDSFHATVFSLIFKKQFFVFNRNKKDNMNSRIHSLVDLFDAGNRFCTSEEMACLNYIKSVPDHNYDVENLRFAEMASKSTEYLLNIKEAKQAQ